MAQEIYRKRINKLLSFVSDIPGDVIEVGIFKGKTSEIICRYIQDTSDTKRFIGIDTFEGYMDEDMVNVNSAAIANQVSKRWHWSKDSVEKRLNFFDKMRYSIVEGDCKVKIPELVKNGDIQELSLIYIDCNLYIPSLKAMTDLWPLLAPGGIMAIDEHLTGGETQAISEFAKMHNLNLSFFGPSPGPSFYCYKPMN